MLKKISTPLVRVSLANLVAHFHIRVYLLGSRVCQRDKRMTVSLPSAFHSISGGLRVEFCV